MRHGRRRAASTSAALPGSRTSRPTRAQTATGICWRRRSARRRAPRSCAAVSWPTTNRARSTSRSIRCVLSGPPASCKVGDDRAVGGALRLPGRARLCGDALLGKFIWPFRLAFPWRPAGAAPTDPSRAKRSARATSLTGSRSSMPGRPTRTRCAMRLAAAHSRISSRPAPAPSNAGVKPDVTARGCRCDRTSPTASAIC